MSDFSFLAVPNIQGMRLGWYIQIFGIVIIFGVCLFLVIYFRLKYRRRKNLFQQVDHIDQQAHDLGKQILIQKIQKSLGKNKLILFIEYLEKFVTNKPYANISQLLVLHGFTQQEAEECEKALYTEIQISKYSEHIIDDYFIP